MCMIQLLPVVAAPNNIYLADAQKGDLLFSWNSVITNDCSGVKYNIISDCGTCPTITNGTTATCSDLQLSNSTALCHFRVSSAVCDQAENYFSPKLAVKLKGIGKIIITCIC